MSEHERLSRIERKLNAVLHGLHYLITRESDVSKLHDDLKALADGVDAAADRVISAKTEGENSLADVITQFEAIRDKLNAAAEDNAASGSSTGAGSGSGLRAPNDNVGQFLSGSTKTDSTGGSS
jgi:Flp pilus assembly protein TadG